MNTQLFIPKKCKVGFNLRTDTYTGKLGYVIAFDGKKWRKEPSWEGWRQKEDDSMEHEYVNGKRTPKGEKYGDKVKPIEFDNAPTAGFVLNKKAGGGCSHWNTRRTVSRIYDPRGFEFEIGIDNLLYILEHCNCMRGKGLEGEFIYSWDGKDLVLLPCSSPEAVKANEYTDLQACKISAKDLVPGCSYKTKKEEDLIYVGRHMWYETNWYDKKGRKGKKCHIFFQEAKTITDEDGFKEDVGGNFAIKNDVSFLAIKNSEEPVSNFAKIVDKFNKDSKSSDILKWELVPTTVKTELKNTDYYGPKLKKPLYFKQEGDMIIEYYVCSNNAYSHQSNKYEHKDFGIGISRRINISTKEVEQVGYYSDYSTNSGTGKKIEEKDLQNYGLCDLFVTLESGKRVKLNSLYEI